MQKTPFHARHEQLQARMVEFAGYTMPIQYKGITEDQILQIAKTFRELEAPFYVHCFHGKHRGPAAAAIGSVALDGLDRDTAIAEMRQWCSTAQKYEGLYATVATADIPTADETAAFEFDFTSSHQFTGMRDAMITLTRSWDEVKLIRKNGWEASAAVDMTPGAGRGVV